ncbi:MAG: DUF3887 domain-containing protein [Carboxylicivirga sp.]|jgi:murein DD-endopeptidase MepM/ murein hydrolase activator NlpD|nr:DUF3887 domain-containing protein [Carboxylicivirga sp.]
MKNLLILSILLICLPAQSQNETIASKTTAAKFEQLYNADQYQEIFNLFSANMQQALPLNKTSEFLSGLKRQAGTIKNREFLRYEQGISALYKTQFERATFAVYIALDNNNKINGLFVKPYTESNYPVLKRNLSELILPFNGEWTVVWGGTTKDLNYHVEHQAQKGAFDFVITDEKGKSYASNGQNNTDYYAFGKDIISPCDAEVVLVVDGVKDNKPGELNPIYAPGNTVILKTANKEYLFFAHFKQQSIVVKQGQLIKQGDLLGRCGNSGNSSEAHLHFHIQNIEDMNKATGASCFFQSIMLNDTITKDYMPIKGDKVRNN